MNRLPDPETCPVDLDFTEPDPPALDVGPIVARGRRIRRRRRLAAAGSAIVACAAVASIITGARGGTFRWLPQPAGPAGQASGTAPASVGALIAAHPPVTGTLTLLSRWPAHWTTVAWATRAGDLCWATYLGRAADGNQEVECPEWSRADVTAAGRGGLSWLMPGTLRKSVTSFGLPNTLEWRDAYGTWNDGTRPACLEPHSRGQHVTLGIVSVEPVRDAPGGDTVAWVECARRPVPHFRIVDPHSTQP